MKSGKLFVTGGRTVFSSDIDLVSKTIFIRVASNLKLSTQKRSDSTTIMPIYYIIQSL